MQTIAAARPGAATASGRARDRPLTVPPNGGRGMAKALIIDDDYGRLAIDYYAKFPEEPISKTATLKVESTQSIPTTSLDTLLSSIQGAFKDTKEGKDLVIASHGNSLGMLMPLFPKHSKSASSENLLILMGSEARDKKAAKLSLKPDQVDQLMSKMEAVRKIGLGHVAFRGCTIGEKPKNLTTLKDLLAAGTVSATNLYSTYGYGLPKTFKDKKAFEKQWSLHEKDGHLHTGKARVILVTRPGKEAFTEIIELYLETQDVMLEWLQTHFVAGTKADTATAVANKVPLHYLSFKPPVLPLDGTHKGVAEIGYADFIRDTNDTSGT
jgi:hypothetical protein